MKTFITTSLLLLSTFMLFSMASDTLPTTAITCATDNCKLTCEFRQVLLKELHADQLVAQDAQHVKIEFEYHDIFVNETILDYEMIAKYQVLFRAYGITPGPQRQIRLMSDGNVVIGDFGLQNELLEPVQLQYVGR